MYWVRTMNYDIVRNAVATYIHDEPNPQGCLGMHTILSTTAAVDKDGSLVAIPLDILSTSVNLRTLWTQCRTPIAIVFREIRDDWYAVIPCDETLVRWEIFNLPGKDHMIHRGRALAERAIRSDFGIETATVL